MSVLRRLLKTLIPSQPLQTALARAFNEFKIARASVSPNSPQFSTLQGRKDLKLHLGCGADVRSGWINIDLMLTAPAGFDLSQPNTACISYDLRNGLPVPDGCAKMVFSSHFFEHLEYWHGKKLMADCYRALQSGGIFRIVLPDYKLFFKAYLAGDRSFFEPLRYGLVEAETATLADFMTYAVYQFGEHCAIYDVERLEVVLRNIGYGEVRVSQFDPAIDVDNELRRKFSFYVEAVKI